MITGKHAGTRLGKIFTAMKFELLVLQANEWLQEVPDAIPVEIAYNGNGTKDGMESHLLHVRYRKAQTSAIREFRSLQMTDHDDRLEEEVTTLINIDGEVHASSVLVGVLMLGTARVRRFVLAYLEYTPTPKKT